MIPSNEGVPGGHYQDNEILRQRGGPTSPVPDADSYEAQLARTRQNASELDWAFEHRDEILGYLQPYLGRCREKEEIPEFSVLLDVFFKAGNEFVYLDPIAPQTARNAFAALKCLDAMLFYVGRSDVFAVAALASEFGWALCLTGAASLLPHSAAGQRRQAAAGMQQRQDSPLTDEQIRRAREIVSEHQGSGESISGACVRASAKLKEVFGIDVTPRTIASVLRDVQ